MDYDRLEKLWKRLNGPGAFDKHKARRKAVAKAKANGFKVNFVSEYPDTQWDGKGTFSLFEDEFAGYDVLHDIAHYACASKARRKLREFGLGSGPGTAPYESMVRKPAKKTVSAKAAQKEEEQASLLGILMAFELKLPVKKILASHAWYGWDNAFADTIDMLISRKLINKDFSVNWPSYA